MEILLHNLKQKKYIIQTTIFFGLFLVIYFILDYLNMSYSEMNSTYGVFLVIVNVILNIIMAFLSSLLLVSSEVMIKATRASNLGFVAIIFGVLTYGCTTCVIALFANFGIILSVIALPFAGLPYKLFSLVLIVVGLFFSIRQLKRGCKIKTNE